MQTIIFFDIDSTLIENRFTYPLISEIMQPVLDSSGLSPEQVGQALFEENTRRQQENPNDPHTMDWDDILETVAARHNVQLTRRLIDGWRERSTPEYIDVLDQAGDVLAQLKQPHRKLVISTKGLSKYQEPVLKAVGLFDLFDDHLTPDRTGYLKTQPEYFGAYTGNGRTARFIQVGDHCYDDVICAKRNGFTAIQRVPIDDLRLLDPFERPAKLAEYREQISTYPTQGMPVLPDAVVVSLEELPSLITQIESQ